MTRIFIKMNSKLNNNLISYPRHIIKFETGEILQTNFSNKISYRHKYKIFEKNLNLYEKTDEQFATHFHNNLQLN